MTKKEELNEKGEKIKRIVKAGEKFGEALEELGALGDTAEFNEALLVTIGEKQGDENIRIASPNGNRPGQALVDFTKFSG